MGGQIRAGRGELLPPILTMPKSSSKDFEKLAAEREIGLISELWLFLKHTKKFWLLPLVITLVVVGFLVYLSSSAAAPFIYTLF